MRVPARALVHARRAIRYTAEVAGARARQPGTPGPRARARSRAGGREPAEAQLETLEALQDGGTLRFGSWLGARHSPAQDAYKLYAEIPRDLGPPATAALERLFPWGLDGTLQPRGAGLELDTSAYEVYFRCAGVIESWQVERLLWRLGVAEALPPLRELIEQACERPFERAARGPNLGVSVAFTSGGTVAAFSLFGYARRLLGADAVARRRVLAVATAHGGTFAAMSASARRSPTAFPLPQGMAWWRSWSTRGGDCSPGDAVPSRGRRMSASSIIPARSTRRPALRHAIADGSFPATIHMPTGRQVPDRNCFVTAQVLRALTPATLPAERRVAVGRALAFLERSGSSERPGAWGFWPRGEGLRPSWIPEPPLDCDDTAIVALELARWGQIDPPAAIRIATGVLLSERLVAIDWPAPPWFGEGVFVTWMEDDGRPQVIDCAVNANVAALFAHLGLRSLPGYSEACAMIERAVTWAGDSAVRARTLAPCLPGPIGKLALAIEYVAAGRAGAEELRPALERTRSAAWSAPIAGRSGLLEHVRRLPLDPSDAVTIAREIAAGLGAERADRDGIG